MGKSINVTIITIQGQGLKILSIKANRFKIIDLVIL